MKLSFLVTTHNEGQQLFKLLMTLNEFIKSDTTENEVIILDDYSTDKTTQDIIDDFVKIKEFSVCQHHLNKDYGAHKNYGTDKCSGEYIFAIDADEFPASSLLYNVKDIITANPSVDLFGVPRVNIVYGLTQEYVQMFQWRVSQVDGFNGLPIINWPDQQSRIYRRCDTIKWSRKLHEHIIGSKVTTNLPIDPEFALIHEKTLERQVKQNQFYNSNFTPEDNVRIS